MKKLLYPECIIFYAVLTFFIFGGWMVNGIVGMFNHLGLLDKGVTVTNPANTFEFQIYKWMMFLSFFLLFICTLMVIRRWIRKA